MPSCRDRQSAASGGHQSWSCMTCDSARANRLQLRQGKSFMTQNPSNTTSKTKWMNIVGAVLWALTGCALFAQKLGAQMSSNTLTMIVVLYSFIVLIPAGTAVALSSPSKIGLRKVMIGLNGLLILLVVLGFAAGMYLRTSGFSSYLGLLMFLVPAGLNLKALQWSAIRSQTAREQ